MIDPADLTRRLMQCASVTPKDDGALAVLQAVLERVGFGCVRVDRNGIGNLFARWGEKGHSRTLGFNGHTDVVPPGDLQSWRFPPFSATEYDGWLWGRGATDMKSGVAAFTAAAADFVVQSPPNGALVIAITGDEEGLAVDGTVAILDWMAKNGEVMTHCLVGEPTSLERTGDVIKIGRRGSITARFRALGVQGHSAYPHLAKNAAEAIAFLVHRLKAEPLDSGSQHFGPSTLAVTTIDVGNPATNVVPGEASATVNIRFNDLHNGEGLAVWLRERAQRTQKETGVEIELETRVSGESFFTEPGTLTDLLTRAVFAETGANPELSTSGGTSDARFIKDHCPVVELGLVGRTMHQVDERVEIAQIHLLKALYTRVLHDYFA